jgi:hypothetical protein
MSAWPRQQDPACRGQPLDWKGLLTGALWSLPALALLSWLGTYRYVLCLLAAMALTIWWCDAGCGAAWAA